MDKRLLLAMTLSMAVLIGYYLIFPPAPSRPPDPAPVTKAEQQAGQPAGPAATQGATQQAAPLLQAAPAATESTTTAVARTVTIRTPLYEATVDTRGGVLSAFLLADYRVNKINIDWADLIPPLRQWIAKPEIMPEAHEDMAPPPLTEQATLGLRFVGEESLTRQFAATVFDADQQILNLERGNGQARTLVLRGSTADGLTVEKRLTFHPDSYIVDYALSVANHGEQPRSLRVASIFGEGPQGTRLVAGGRSHTGPIWRTDGSLNTEDADDVATGLVVGEPDWMGLTDNYFLTAAQPTSPIGRGFYESKQVVPPGSDAIWLATFGMELPPVELTSGKMTTGAFKLYLGPKRVSQMEKFGSKLETSLDLTLDILAQPMLALMRWFYSFTGNYGVSIILLTVVVRVLLFPLTYRGMLSIKRMQKLQPRMAALREKFKKDKERLNKEMMVLYRKHKMNPLGGCLPIALQIPIFFALYSALLGAIELRHEPFMLWITDLSAQDGLYISPILMGGSMLIQQRLTPTAMDPTQAKIMMWMPVVFTAFMLSFPSGLVVYWLTSNSLSIVQQVLINRIKVPEPQD